MDGEAAVFPDVVSVPGTGLVVGVPGVADGVDEHSARPQYPSHLGDQGVDLLGGQRHAEQHVGEHGIHRGVRERQRPPDVMDRCGDPPCDVLGRGGFTQLFQTHRTEVGGQHGEALAGEVQRITAMAGTQLQHLPGIGGPEDGSGVDRRIGWLLPVHAGMLAVDLLPVGALNVAQPLLPLRHADALLTRSASPQPAPARPP